jgi:hypothetical protein
MATRFVLADCFAVMRVRISPSPDQPLSRLSLNPYDPLAPSSAHDQWHCKALPLPPSVRCASLSTCSPLIRARRAYPTPRLPVKGAPRKVPALGRPVAPSPPPGLPAGAWLVSPSLKEPPNHTTRIMLCQVLMPGRGRSPRSAPPRGGSAGKRCILPHTEYYVKYSAALRDYPGSPAAFGHLLDTLALIPCQVSNAAETL